MRSTVCTLLYFPAGLPAQVLSLKFFTKMESLDVLIS